MRKKIGGKIGPGSPANMGHMGKSTAKMMKKSPLELETDPPNTKPKDAKTVSDSISVEYDYIAKTRPMAYETIFRKADKSVELGPYYSPKPSQRRRDLLDNTRSIASRFGIDTKKAYKK